MARETKTPKVEAVNTELFQKIEMNVTDAIVDIFNTKLEQAKASKTNVLWALGINAKGYEDVSIIVIVTPTSTDAILDSKFTLREKNNRKFYMASIVEGTVDIVEVK